MLFHGPQNISIFRVGIKSGVGPCNIPKVDFMIALNRILTTAVPSYGDGSKVTLKIF
jgi:hypothetical protein